jgi:zinc protease
VKRQLPGALALVVAGGLAGCASAPPPPPPAAALQPTSAAIPLPETPDDALRYRPPLVEPASGWLPPRATEARLPSGARIVVFERHALPLVAIDISILREEPTTAADWLVLELLLGSSAPGSGEPLRGALASLGMSIQPSWSHDRFRIHLKGPARAAGEALALVARSAASLTPTEDLLRRTKARLDATFKDDKPRPTPRAELLTTVDAVLAPKGHAYTAPPLTRADVARVQLGDVAARVRRALSPDRVRVGVAGDVTADALRAAMEPATRGWKAEPARKGPPPALARGVHLVETGAAGNVEVAIVWPAPPEDAAITPAWTIARLALQTSVFAKLGKALSTWTNGVCRTTERRSLGLDYLAFSVEPKDLAEATRVALEALDAAAKGDLPDDAIEGSRRSHLRFLGNAFVSAHDASERATVIALHALGPDALTRTFDAQAKVTGAEVRAAAKARIDRKQMRVVAMGTVEQARGEMAKLGLGKVTVVRRSAGKKP